MATYNSSFSMKDFLTVDKNIPENYKNYYSQIKDQINFFCEN
jgi:hypothetical protein